MKNTVFNIKGVFGTDYYEHVFAINREKQTMERMEPFISLRTHSGEIWVNGKKITPKAALRLRKFFGSPFGWGHSGEIAAVTALAICLHIFKRRQIALRLYQSFLKTFVATWPAKSFDITIDITDFLIDNRERFDGHNLIFCSHFYRYGNTFCYHEIDVVYDFTTHIYTVQLLDYVRKSFYTEEPLKEYQITLKEKYETIFGKQPVVTSKTFLDVGRKVNKLFDKYYEPDRKKINATLKELRKREKELIKMMKGGNLS